MSTDGHQIWVNGVLGGCLRVYVLRNTSRQDNNIAQSPEYVGSSWHLHSWHWPVNLCHCLVIKVLLDVDKLQFCIFPQHAEQFQGRLKKQV